MEPERPQCSRRTPTATPLIKRADRTGDLAPWYPPGGGIPMPQPFRAFDYVLCVAAFFLTGIAVVPLLTTWIR